MEKDASDLLLSWGQIMYNENEKKYGLLLLKSEV